MLSFLFSVSVKELIAVGRSCHLVSLFVSFFGEKNRTDEDKLPIAVRKEKHNTWTHGLL